MGKVTIRSIASDLGLSRNTVSMALRGNELVAPRTRERILQYAQKVGYIDAPAQTAGYTGTSPQTAGYTGSAQKTGSIGAPAQKDGEGRWDGTNPEYRVMILRRPDVAVYWDKVVNGISEEASRCHCKTQVVVVTEEQEKQQRLPLGIDENVQAVFCVKLMDRGYIGKIRQMGIYVFLLDDYLDSGNEMIGDVVKMESFQPTAWLTRHLIGQGMRRIGFIGDRSSQYESMHDRLSGYLYAMEQAGLGVKAELVASDQNADSFYSPETFEEMVNQYHELPEAVVCGNDQIAMFLTKELRRRGIRVPEDVAVTGFDDDEDGMLEPFFTTVHVDAKWLGQRMVQCFLWRIQHPDAPYEKIVVEGRVVVRRSSRHSAGSSE